MAAKKMHKNVRRQTDRRRRRQERRGKGAGRETDTAMCERTCKDKRKSHTQTSLIARPRHKVTFAPKSIKYFYTPDSDADTHILVSQLGIPPRNWSTRTSEGEPRSRANGKLFTQVISIF